MLDVFVKRDLEEVNQAVMQFVARRSYSLTQPWYLEGLRIEIPLPKQEGSKGFWSAFSESPANPRIDLELKRKRNGTRLKITIGSHAESIKLAYELQTYLQDDMAYSPMCPAVCFKCGNPVRNAVAKYCGRCGQRFVAATADDGRRSPITVAPAAQPARPTAYKPPPPVPVSVERDPDVELEIDEELADSSSDAAVATEPETLGSAATDADARMTRKAGDVDSPVIRTGDSAELIPVMEPTERQAAADTESGEATAKSNADGDADVPDEPIEAPAESGSEEEHTRPAPERRRALAEE